MFDIGSSTNILYFYTFKKFRLLANDLTPVTFMLMRFTSDSISPLQYHKPTYHIWRWGPFSKIVMTKFMVVNIISIQSYYRSTNIEQTIGNHINLSHDEIPD